MRAVTITRLLCCRFFTSPPHPPVAGQILLHGGPTGTGECGRGDPTRTAVPTRITPNLSRPGWEEGLASYPDKAFASFILRGISSGFRIGVPGSFMGKHAKRNLQSAREHKGIVQDYLDRVERLGRIQRLSADDEALLPTLQISPFGVIPKRNRPGKWRLIIDLSSPHGHSINDTISKDLSSISYTSLNNAATFIQHLDPGCLLAKLDLKEAYRAVPVHPANQPRLAVRWNNTAFLDRALPFGLCSAPKLFSALTDGLMWILHSKGVQWDLHYLDDFLLLRPAGSPDCQAALDTTLGACECLWLQVAPEKTEGPCTQLTFLGIEIDTVANQLRLPRDKQENLQTALRYWTGLENSQGPRRSGSKREPLSLIDLLNHAAKVVQPGRALLRNLISISSTVDSLDHRVHLNRAAREDLAWWHTFQKNWNGVSVLPPATPAHYFTSDASWGWSCGATYRNL